MDVDASVIFDVFLKGAQYNYGVDKSELLAIANKNKASQEIIELISNIHDHTYTSGNELLKELNTVKARRAMMIK